MPTLHDAQEKVRSIAKAMQDTVSDAELTQAEKKSRLDNYEGDLKRAQDDVELHRQVKKLTEGEFNDDGEAKPAVEQSTTTKSIGQQVTESDGYKAAIARKGGMFSTGSIELKTINTIDEGGLGAGFPTPMYLPGVVQIRTLPLVVTDLFAQGTTTSATISYVKESQWQNSAAAVAEKGTKPQSDLTVVRVTETVSKIATVAKVTDEMLEDVPQFQSYLDNRLTLGVKLTEQAEVLAGSGTAPHLNGILNRSGLQTTVVEADPPSGLDALYTQITAIRATAFLEPDAIVIHPTDWQKIRLLKDGQGQYYGGGPFTGAYGNGTYSNVEMLWGLKVVVTPAITLHTALVGAFQMGGQVFRKGGLTVESTNSNEDDFKNNLVAVRAEERLALAVYYPSGFGKVTLT